MLNESSIELIYVIKSLADQLLVYQSILYRVSFSIGRVKMKHQDLGNQSIDSNLSSAKYKKFKGIIKHKTIDQYPSPSNNSRQLIKYPSNRSFSIKNKDYLFTPQSNKKIIGSKKTEKWKSKSKKDKIPKVLQLIDELMVQIRQMVCFIERQAQRTIDNVIRNMKSSLKSYFIGKEKLSSDISQLQKMFTDDKPGQKGKRNFEVIRTESLTTSEERFQKYKSHPYNPHEKHPGFTHPIQLRQKMKNAGQQQIKHHTVINRQKEKERNLEGSCASKRSTSKDKSISQKVKGLQDKINGIKSILKS